MTPIILRPTKTGTYNLVGECYVHGLMRGESLLGPLPHPWKFRLLRDELNILQPSFWNSDTNTSKEEDPRLGGLPPDWERIEHERTSDDALLYSYHRNTVTGEVINSDPRMFPEALAARGVKLEQFLLV